MSPPAPLPVSDSVVSLLRSTQGAPVPLVGVALVGRVFGGSARVAVRQRYRNAESKPVEAIYTFPIPSDASLVGFAMECDGRRIEGVVQEREEAFRTYDDALVAGHGAALVEQERHNVFTANVGNLLPGEETVIEVVYVQRLVSEEGALRLCIPTVVAPRYIPGAASGDPTGHGAVGPTDRVPDADRITPRIGPVGYGLELDVLFDVGRALRIESPSHSLVVSREGLAARVRLAASHVQLDRDLVLLAAGETTESETLAASVVADKASEGDGTFALTLVPDLFDGAERVSARDVVFLVDTSGSMAGDSIREACAALRLCLRHLSRGDRFGIVGFSSQVHPMSPALVPFGETTLAEADRFVASLHAAGGTEMLEPLRHAARALRASEGRDRLVVLLTDGQVGNESELVERFVAEAPGVRVTTFGIGTSVSDELVRELARRSKGSACFIYPGERLDDKVTAEFAKASAPRVSGLQVRFVGLDAGELAPGMLPDLVDGEPLTLYGRYSAAGAGAVELTGTLRGEPFVLHVPCELPAAAAREGLAAMWATARIRDLEDAESGLSGRRAQSSKDRIVRLSVEHGVASKYASFVVVEKRTGARRASGQPEARPIAVSAPAGWTMASAHVPAARGGGWAAFGSAAPQSVVLHAVAPPASLGSVPSFGPPPAAAPAAPPAPAAPRRSAAMLWDDSEGAFLARKASAKEEHGFFSAMATRLRALVGGAPAGAASDGRAEAEVSEGAALSPPSPAMGSVPHAAQAHAGSLQERFQRQLASGLFGLASETRLAQVSATVEVLAACRAEGTTASHPVLGAQVRKAIDALLDALTELGNEHGLEELARRGLLLACVLSGGVRHRKAIAQAALASPFESVKALGTALVGPAEAEAELSKTGA